MATDPLDPETDFPLHIFSKEKEGEIFKGGRNPFPPSKLHGGARNSSRFHPLFPLEKRRVGWT